MRTDTITGPPERGMTMAAAVISPINRTGSAARHAANRWSLTVGTATPTGHVTVAEAKDYAETRYGVSRWEQQVVEGVPYYRGECPK